MKLRTSIILGIFFLLVGIFFFYITLPDYLSLSMLNKVAEYFLSGDGFVNLLLLIFLVIFVAKAAKPLFKKIKEQRENET